MGQSGNQFNYVLDYHQSDRYVYHPENVFMAAFLSDLIYYGIEVDKRRIVSNYGSVARTATWTEDTIKSWRINISIMTVVEHCATKYRQNHQLATTIYHPAYLSSPIGNVKPAQKLWDALST